MMRRGQSLSARLEQLEAKLIADGLIVLPREEGESRAACIRRHGYDPEDRRVTFVLANKLDQLL